MFQPLNEPMQHPLPYTVEQAVETLYEDISFRDRVLIANLSEIELESSLYRAVAKTLRKEFKLYSGNTKLLDSCCRYIGWKYQDQDEPAMILIKELWEKVKKNHVLRLVDTTKQSTAN